MTGVQTCALPICVIHAVFLIVAGGSSTELQGSCILLGVGLQLFYLLGTFTGDSKEDLMEAKRQILGVGENMGTEESKKIWEKNAQFWDNAMGDESNEFHREVVRPKVTELLSPNPMMSGFLLLDNFQSFSWLYMNLFMFATLL